MPPNLFCNFSVHFNLLYSCNINIGARLCNEPSACPVQLLPSFRIVLTCQEEVLVVTHSQERADANCNCTLLAYRNPARYRANV